MSPERIKSNEIFCLDRSQVQLVRVREPDQCNNTTCHSLTVVNYYSHNCKILAIQLSAQRRRTDGNVYCFPITSTRSPWDNKSRAASHQRLVGDFRRHGWS